jgi:hypothetical protein
MHEIACASLEEENFDIATSTDIGKFQKLLSKFFEFTASFYIFMIEFSLDDSSRLIN